MEKHRLRGHSPETRLQHPNKYIHGRPQNGRFMYVVQQNPLRSELISTNFPASHLLCNCQQPINLCLLTLSSMLQLKKKAQFHVNIHGKPCQINSREKYFSSTNNTSHSEGSSKIGLVEIQQKARSNGRE